MTKSEYQELVEFIAPRFDRMDRRFETIDKRLSSMDTRLDTMDERSGGFEERFTRLEILGEDTRHQIQIVAEAVAETVSTEKFEEFRSEVAAGFEDLRDLLQASHLDLNRRVTRLEEGRSR